MAKNPERFIAVFDTHGHKADPHACGVMFEFLRQWKPQVRIHGGDAFDFAALRKGASDEEKREPLHDDIAAGIEFMERFKPTHFLRGNHDERLFDLMDSDDGKLADYGCGVWSKILDAIGDAQLFPYDKRKDVFRYGDHAFVHGYQGGMYAARHAASVYGNVVMGHVHAVDQASVPRIDGAIGRCAGAMCQLDQRYNRGHVSTLRQGHGWVYGFKHREQLVVYQAQPINGNWFLPTEFGQVKSR